MPFALDHRRHGGGGSGKSKHTKRTGVRTRAEAAAEIALSEDEYLVAYRDFFTSLLPEARLALQRQIVARVEVCGNSGLVENEVEYERLITEGLMPYTDPITLNDGIVPTDTVHLHDRCVSRRTMIAYLESRAENAGHVPRLFDGIPLTRADMALLDLDADDYRFFNANRRRTLPVPAVAYEPPAQDINDDDDDNDRVETLSGDDAEVAYDRMRTALINMRAEDEVEQVDAEIDTIIDPVTTLQEMTDILTTSIALPIALDDEYVANLLVEFGVDRVPELEGFADPWEDFEEFIPLNLNVGQRQAVSEMVASYYMQNDRLITPENHRLLMEKLRYLLFNYTIMELQGDDEASVSYQYYPFEICQTIQHALNWNDIALLYLLDEWIDAEEPLRNPNLGHEIPCASAAVDRAFQEYRRRYNVQPPRLAQPADDWRRWALNPSAVNELIQRIIHYEPSVPARDMEAD